MENIKIKRENLDWYFNQPKEVQLGLFENYIAMSKILFNQLMVEEEKEKTGKKYSRGNRYSRWGTNPGSIRIGEEKIKVDVPRFYDKDEGRTEEASSYKRLREIPKPSLKILKKILLGLSQHDYKAVTRNVIESFGMSQSNVSQAFIEESSRLLEEFENRDLGNCDYVALVIDGKYLRHENIVIALGITMTGVKIPLGFVQTTTENSEAVKGLLKNLIERNFRFNQGILTIIDGSKGLRKAIKETFGELALIQRCQWHKRENVVSYLREEEKDKYRGKLQRAYSEPEYETAKKRIYEIIDELRPINRTAANSLEEGLEETLTMHRLGLIEDLGKSFTTTNLIENLNSQLGKYVRKVKLWRNSNMKARWIAVALLEIENRMRRVNNYEKLKLLRLAIKSELKLDKEEVA
jgi:transposase-like protein